MGDRSGSGKDGMLCEIHPADKPQIAKSGGQRRSHRQWKRGAGKESQERHWS